jgi:hypothetical protein
MSKTETKQIGVVGVDSGTMLLGDPCYWLSDKDYEKEVVHPNFDKSRQICYDLGHAGKGVIVSSGYGDGCYPVIAKFQDGRVKEVTVKFF